MIAVDRQAAKALHTQIYDAYRTAMVTGSRRPRPRIPSTRVLATELGVSRFPVLNAYAQLLAEGYFESRVGAGTVVSSLLPEQLPLDERRVDQRGAHQQKRDSRHRVTDYFIVVFDVGADELRKKLGRWTRPISFSFAVAVER
jgi:DNA-binding transcriptional regulator YhcF (GntR family)